MHSTKLNSSFWYVPCIKRPLQMTTILCFHLNSFCCLKRKAFDRVNTEFFKFCRPARWTGSIRLAQTIMLDVNVLEMFRYLSIGCNIENRGRSTIVNFDRKNRSAKRVSSQQWIILINHGENVKIGAIINLLPEDSTIRSYYSWWTDISYLWIGDLSSNRIEFESLHQCDQL